MNDERLQPLAAFSLQLYAFSFMPSRFAVML